MVLHFSPAVEYRKLKDICPEMDHVYATITKQLKNIIYMNHNNAIKIHVHLKLSTEISIIIIIYNTLE